MDVDELDPIDVLAFTTEELQARHSKAKNYTDEVKVFQDFLRRWDGDTKLQQQLKQIKIVFEKDLDWFNVSQPITNDALKGKIVILDFFTYCCINCMHVLPELHALEKLFPIERGLVVIGVHSPKFENEKDTINIASAAQRYNISHPIMNDPRSSLWRSIGIRCWPSLLVLSPLGDPMILLMGEGHEKFLKLFVEQSLLFFEKKQQIENFSLPISTSLTNFMPASKLRFPAKIARSDDNRFAIADAGNNRILVVNNEGVVQHKIGAGTAGFLDGNFSEAQFKNPQGVTFLDLDTLIVADTENHTLRKIKLNDGKVETLAGTGQQGHDRIGGKIGLEQAISSPWDVAVFRTKDMDMSFHVDEQNVHEKAIILIAMAGTHQIWGFFADGIIWWKFRKFEPLTCVSLVGNGLEENRNNSYPQNAAFAQPSGLAMANNFLFIADSESSSIRKVSMLDGKVTACCGGDRNPLNLFAYGDVDGKQYNAKLQHPLGVAYNHVNDKIYVADTYNHKIKIIDPITNSVETLQIKDEMGKLYKFNEPASLCFDTTGNFLLVSDTNNHVIKRVNMAELTVTTFNIDFSYVNVTSVTDAPTNTGTKLVHYLPLNSCKEITLHMNIILNGSFKYTAEAKQKWTLDTTNSLLKMSKPAGYINDGKFTLHMTRNPEGLQHLTTDANVTLNVVLSLCDVNKCLIKRITIIFCDDPSSSHSNEILEKVVNIVVD